MDQNRGGNAPSSMPGGSGGAPGSGASSANVSYSGANVLSEDATLSNVTYTSASSAQNALLVSGGNVSIKNINVSKTGADSGDNSDFYGTNAAVLAYNGATLTIDGGEILTSGEHANAVFAYGKGVINISNVVITTSASNSGGVMVTGGGTLNAKNLTIHTSGNSAAAIRSDRGGGAMVVDGGTYQADGTGSPAIYSTADITVKNATLLSTASEGVVIEGLNSVTLEKVNLTDTNNKLNGNSETYKNIFIYQSMSGDAAEGTGTFSATDSKIITNNGDNFFVTNTTAVINLTGNAITNYDNSGVFLRAQSGKWGNSGSNGGIVALNAARQEVIGDIVVDSISAVALNLDYSYFKGAMTGDGIKNLIVSKDSVVVLTADTYLTSLDNALASNSNIYANGFKLYVGMTEVNINQAEAPASFLSGEIEEEVVKTTTASDNTATNSAGFPVWGYFAIGGVIIIIAAVAAFFIIRQRKAKQAPRSIVEEPKAGEEPFNGAPGQTPTI